MLGADIPIVIAGNKFDLEKNRHIQVEVAEEYVSFFQNFFFFFKKKNKTSKTNED